VSNWVRAAALADIRDGGARSFAYLDRRIALFRTSGGVFACDNRCPHQGYALVRGEVKEGVLTCAWHNWKFELGTGVCRHGGENIRTYPVQIRDGQVFVDVTDPSAEVVSPDLFASLTAGSAEPIAAAARFLASPKRERFVYQSTLEAITTLRGVPKPESDQVRSPVRAEP
jgi:nitrite reductase/ring-hydroxylating ferredoxin subunit